MKRLIIKPYERITITLLGLIGLLTGCNLIHSPVAEYGVPHADYEINGTVTDSITSAPVKNVQVTISRSVTTVQKDTTFTHVDTLAVKGTDSSGKYDAQFQTFPLEDLSFNVKVNDIDGPSNGGEFLSKQLDIVFKLSDLSGGKGWYNGKALKTMDFKLKKK